MDADHSAPQHLAGSQGNEALPDASAPANGSAPAFELNAAVEIPQQPTTLPVPGADVPQDTQPDPQASIDDILAATVDVPMSSADEANAGAEAVPASLAVFPPPPASTSEVTLDPTPALPSADAADILAELPDTITAPMSTEETTQLLQAPASVEQESSSTILTPTAETQISDAAELPVAVSGEPIADALEIGADATSSASESAGDPLQTSLIGSSASAVAAATAALSTGTSSGLPSIHTADGVTPATVGASSDPLASEEATTSAAASLAAAETDEVAINNGTISATPAAAGVSTPTEGDSKLALERVPSLPIAERLPLMGTAFALDKDALTSQGGDVKFQALPTPGAQSDSRETPSESLAEVGGPIKTADVTVGEVQSDVTAASVSAEVPRLPTPASAASGEVKPKAQESEHDAATSLETDQYQAKGASPLHEAAAATTTVEAPSLTPRPSASRANSTSAAPSRATGTATGSTLAVPSGPSGRITRSHSPRTPLTALPAPRKTDEGHRQKEEEEAGEAVEPSTEDAHDSEAHPPSDTVTRTGEKLQSGESTLKGENGSAEASQPGEHPEPHQANSALEPNTAKRVASATEAPLAASDRPASPPTQIEAPQPPPPANPRQSKSASRQSVKQSSIAAPFHTSSGHGPGGASKQTPALDQERAARQERERVERLERERKEQELQERQRRARDELAAQENEDRLIWLSLPSNDHPTYYSDTSEASSSRLSSPELSQHPLPFAAKGQAPWLGPQVPLSSVTSVTRPAKRLRHASYASSFRDADEVSNASTVEDEELKPSILGSYNPEVLQGRLNRTGNRGNKLKRRDGVRWIRRGKLGGWTEARGEKEVNDRVRLRMAALQRAGIQSLLKAAPPPHLSPLVPSAEARLDAAVQQADESQRRASTPEMLTSTALAPTLLRPILTPRALLSSHTLRHTFRNPHIAALSKTALDLRESEGTLGRALGRCFADLERSVLPDSIESSKSSTENGARMVLHAPPFVYVDARGGPFTHHAIDADAIGADGTNLTADELNPSFERLDSLFVTPNGLPIPLGSDPNTVQPNGVGHQDGDQPGVLPPAQAVLSPGQQRDVVRAALDCLHELATDSREYVERLDEVRARLAAVKRERTRVWQALRRWALDKEEKSVTANGALSSHEVNGVSETHTSNVNGHASNQGSSARSTQRAAGKDRSSSAANTGSSSRKKARTAAS